MRGSGISFQRQLTPGQGLSFHGRDAPQKGSSELD
jgi:hypothetical protein